MSKSTQQSIQELHENLQSIFTKLNTLQKQHRDMPRLPFAVINHRDKQVVDAFHRNVNPAFYSVADLRNSLFKLVCASTIHFDNETDIQNLTENFGALQCLYGLLEDIENPITKYRRNRRSFIENELNNCNGFYLKQSNEDIH